MVPPAGDAPPSIPAPEHQRWFSVDPPPHPRPPIIAANMFLAVAMVAIAARVSVPIPGTPVPQSLQTLAVVLTGMWLGPLWGAVAMVLYIGAGAAGLPVFADGAAGLEVLTGPTAGYLVGFVLGASVAGWSRRRAWISHWIGFAWMSGMAVLAHVFILGVGWIRLGQVMGGASEAFTAGVAPFLVGGVVKSIGAAIIWMLVELSRPPE